ncbi:ABC transporter permease [Actinocatenispora rupis]|uniref:Peptide ABC transporter permease n=1 Tax=Actinocatenispora rupis TaxID=519421 RepID=A0A8J3J3W5_9ACTN|nr:ABC transporter permease [Actinocatenispora rupis]GID13718.1 peptide ABC transporter permease [Actinocatenispora rupis]
MLKFLRRLAGHVVRGLVMIWIVTTFTFVLVRLMPGDPVQTQYETLLSKGMSPDQAKAQVAVTYGFVPHGSFWSQYGHYLWQLLHFDLGRSVRAQGVSVTTEVLSTAKWTIGLVLAGTLLSFLFGVVLGVVAAMRRNSHLGNGLSIVGSLLHGVPQYVMALILVTFLTVKFKLFSTGPVDGLLEPGFNGPYIASIVAHAVLPAVAFALSSFGGYLLSMKSSVVSVLGDDFILASELRGIRPSIIFRYVARNAILPLFTVLALSLGFMVGGAVFIENAFNYPGMGAMLVASIGQRDYSEMSGAFLLITMAVIIANICADMLYTVIDPRVRRGEGA